MSITEKECRRCGGIKPISDFHRSSKSPDGYQTWCHECINAYKQEWRLKKCSDKDLLARSKIKENKILLRDGLKRCSKCGEIRSVDDFFKGEGTGNLRSMCCYCHRDYRKNNRTATRPDGAEAAMDTVHYAIVTGRIVKPKKCMVCGDVPAKRSYDHSIRIHFHHTNGYDGHNDYIGIFVCSRCHHAIHSGRIEVVGHDYLPETTGRLRSARQSYGMAKRAIREHKLLSGRE